MENENCMWRILNRKHNVIMNIIKIFVIKAIEILKFEEDELREVCGTHGGNTKCIKIF
jgi:hypothetical protein